MCASVLYVATALAATLVHAQERIRFPFEASLSGLDGAVTVTWYTCARVGLTVDLTLTPIDVEQLKALASSCTEPVNKYSWHIHTQWNYDSPLRSGIPTSASFDRCGKDRTGSHYDPYKICGPASEHADTRACAGRLEDYQCTPDAYADDFAAGEAGDLSGKFGNLVGNTNALAKVDVVGVWFDAHFPWYNDVSRQWSLVIGAVCGNTSIPIACSHVQGAPWDRSMKREAHKTATQREDKAVDEEEHVTLVKIDDKLLVQIYVQDGDQ